MFGVHRIAQLQVLSVPHIVLNDPPTTLNWKRPPSQIGFCEVQYCSPSKIIQIRPCAPPTSLIELMEKRYSFWLFHL